MLKENKTNRRTLRMVYDDCNSTYKDLLAGHSDLSIHQKHIKHVATDFYESWRNLNPEFMWSSFKNKPIFYSLRYGNICILPPARSSCYSINLALFRGKLLWNNLPRTVKESVSVKDLKQKFKHIETIHCFCILCRRF